MADLLKRFKKDKKFRVITVLVLFAVLYIFSNQPQKTGQIANLEMCDSYNVKATGVGLVSQVGGWNINTLGCLQAGCIIDTNVNTPNSIFQGITACNLITRTPGNLQTNTARCSGQMLTTAYFIAKDQESADQVCATKSDTIKYGAAPSGNSYCDAFEYHCYQLETGPGGIDAATQCKAWQTPFANIANSIGFKSMKDCSSKSMLVLFGAALLVGLVVVMA